MRDMASIVKMFDAIGLGSKEERAQYKFAFTPDLGEAPDRTCEFMRFVVNTKPNGDDSNAQLERNS